MLCWQEGVDYDGSASSGAEDLAYRNKQEDGASDTNTHDGTPNSSISVV